MKKEISINETIAIFLIRLSIALMFVIIIPAIVHASSTAIHIDDYTNIQWDSNKDLTRTKSEYPFDYTITATGTENIIVYPDLGFTWTATGTGTETWYTFPYQNFIWTVTGTGIETWYEQMPDEGNPADYGFYLSGSAWYKDEKQVTQAGVSEFRVIGGKPFWKYGEVYYYNNMVCSGTLPGRWGHMGKVTQSGVTCFGVIDGKTFWKYGGIYYRNNLVGYDCPGWPCEVGWDGTWGHMGKVTQAGVTEFVIYDDKPYWKLYSKCYYNTLVSYDCPGYPCNAGWDGTWSLIKEMSCPLPSSGSIDPCAFDSNIATRTATDSGSSAVMKTEGNKFISTFSAMPQPQQGGTISDVSYSISDNNANVNTWISGNSVYASTTYSVTNTAARTSTDSGSGTVNKPQGDKDMGSFNAYPQPQQGGTISGITYSISDNNLDVDTWISGSHVYARTDYSEIQSKTWSDTETGSSSVNDSEGDKYIITSTLIAPNDDTIWSVLDDGDYVETWMVVNELYARASIFPVHNLNTGLDYSMIQTAIDAVETINGHTITVDPGTYTENVNVDKELTIKSTSGNPADTIIQAADSNDHVFEVIVDCVNISGFTVTGAGYLASGINLFNADYCCISNNNASNNCNSIYLLDSGNNNIIGNTVLNNNFGIFIEYSNNNTITSNTALNNSQGIHLWFSSSNTLTNNTANSNYAGFFLDYSNSNTIMSNTALNNSGYGIYIKSSSNNLIYNNYFNNTNNAQDEGVNTWNTTITTGPNIIGGPSIGGNYWSDYTGSDDNSDGIGETPKNIIGGLNKDYLPLVYTQIVCGDIDGSGGVNSTDLRLLLDHIFTGAPVNKYTADVDGSDKVNILDARFLMNHIVNPEGYPLDCPCTMDQI